MVAGAVAVENKKRGVATGVKTMYNNHRKSTKRRNDLNYYEYLDQLQKKYGTTNTELLEELAASGIRISKSNLSHKLKGQRRMTDEELDVFIQTVCPTGAEEKTLRTLYKVSQFGEEQYKEVEVIRRGVAGLSDASVIRVPEDLPEPADHTDIRGEKPLTDMILSILRDAWGRGAVLVQCPADFTALYDAICAHSFRCASEVKHLICIDNSTGNSSEFDYVQAVFFADKLARYNIAYEVRYYYDHVNLVGNGFVPFPFYLVTDRFLLLIAHDFKSGFLLRDDKVIARYREEFNRVYSKCQPLLRRTYGVMESLWTLAGLEESCTKHFYVLRHGVSYLQGFDNTMLQTCVPEDLPEREDLISMLKRKISTSASSAGCVLHTDTDADAFLQTGVLMDLPSSMMLPVPRFDRAAMIRRASQAKSRSRRVTSGYLEISPHTSVSCYDSGTVTLVHAGAEPHCFLITEHKFYSAVRSFFLYLLDHESVSDQFDEIIR